MNIGIQGLGFYVPPQVITAEELAEETSIPASVLRQKFGVQAVHRAGPDCHISDMALEAGSRALHDAGVAPEDVNLVVYCGSEYKDFIVWSAAINIAHALNCHHAQAFELYALCAGTPVALRTVKSMMLTEPEIETALIVAASKESALVDRHNQRTRFMFNFGDGASAAVIRRGLGRNRILASTSLVDGSLNEDVIQPVGGSRHPGTGPDVLPYLDVPDPEGMRQRLERVSATNFMSVIQAALQRSRRSSVDLLVPVHMKRSMVDWLHVSLAARYTVYLEKYGHMQAADQFAALHEARQQGQVRDGDTVILAAAGVGYTWAATALIWGDDGASNE